MGAILTGGPVRGLIFRAHKHEIVTVRPDGTWTREPWTTTAPDNELWLDDGPIVIDNRRLAEGDE